MGTSATGAALGSGELGEGLVERARDRALAARPLGLGRQQGVGEQLAVEVVDPHIGRERVVAEGVEIEPGEVVRLLGPRGLELVVDLVAVCL